jgi:hypothetical protein
LSGCSSIVFSISTGETCIPEIFNVSCKDGNQYNAKPVILMDGAACLDAVFETANKIDRLVSVGISCSLDQLTKAPHPHRSESGRPCAPIHPQKFP